MTVRTWRVTEQDAYEAPVEWESSDGICLVRLGYGDQFKAYAPGGLRMIDGDHFDSSEEAKTQAASMYDADPLRWAP